MDLTTATPVQVDTALAEIYERYYAAQRDLALNAKHIEDMETGLERKAQGDSRYLYWKQENLDALFEKREVLKAQAREIRAEERPYQAEYRSRPWSRFFLVRNNGGHIHSSMDCSTCFPTTQFGWLPELSGLSEPDAVASQGAILCTVCYPTAPVEWTDRRDDSVCAGSGTWDYPSETARKGYAFGNYGVCTHCGQNVTLNKGTNKMRKHKKEG